MKAYAGYIIVNIILGAISIPVAFICLLMIHGLFVPPDLDEQIRGYILLFAAIIVILVTNLVLIFKRDRSKIKLGILIPVSIVSLALPYLVLFLYSLISNYI